MYCTERISGHARPQARPHAIALPSLNLTNLSSSVGSSSTAYGSSEYGSLSLTTFFVLRLLGFATGTTSASDDCDASAIELSASAVSGTLVFFRRRRRGGPPASEQAELFTVFVGDDGLPSSSLEGVDLYSSFTSAGCGNWGATDSSLRGSLSLKDANATDVTTLGGGGSSAELTLVLLGVSLVSGTANSMLSTRAGCAVEFSTMTEFLSARVRLAGKVTLAATFSRRPGMANVSKTDWRARAMGPESSVSAAAAEALFASRPLDLASSMGASCKPEDGCMSTVEITFSRGSTLVAEASSRRLQT
eukprot:scaffold24899_cov63-Phaeocystis_antarctica.AAC.1